MEKAPGVPLFQVWGTMTEFEKLQLIKNLTKLEAQLATSKFPVYGGLYLRTDMSRSNRALDCDIDLSQSFCIGPSCDRAFSTEMPLEFNQGPCTLLSAPPDTSHAELYIGDSVSGLGISIAERELFLISREGKQSQSKYYRGTFEQQSQLLEVTMAVMKLLDSNELLKKASQPTLWHTDLHMGNIFVSPDECSKIVSLIDLQSTSVLPAFLQTQWPVFLRPPQN